MDPMQALNDLAQVTRAFRGTADEHSHFSLCIVSIREKLKEVSKLREVPPVSEEAKT